MDELHRSRRGISKEPRNGANCLLRSLRGGNLEGIGGDFNMSPASVRSPVNLWDNPINK